MMSTASSSTKCLEFPSDVKVAEIPKLSLAKLETSSDSELKHLFDTCRQHGFFMLELNESAEGRNLQGHVQNMFDLSSSTFSLGSATLDNYKYNPPTDLLGYKAVGKVKTDDGGVDAMEIYAIGQDESIDFFYSASKVVGTVLNALDEQLSLPHGTLSSLCLIEKASDTSLRMLLNRPSAPNAESKRITLGGHTDIGIITLLFNNVGGLQILPAADENKDANWRYIKPVQDCAIVNLGDTLVEWTGGLLRSSLHRVVRPPGQQATVARESLAYLVRPAREMTMTRLRSEMIPPVDEGQEVNTMSVTEWATERAGQIIRGELRPRTIGGN